MKRYVSMKAGDTVIDPYHLDVLVLNEPNQNIIGITITNIIK